MQMSRAILRFESRRHAVVADGPRAHQCDVFLARFRGPVFELDCEVSQGIEVVERALLTSASSQCYVSRRLTLSRSTHDKNPSVQTQTLAGERGSCRLQGSQQQIRLLYLHAPAIRRPRPRGSSCTYRAAPGTPGPPRGRTSRRSTLYPRLSCSGSGRAT